jgi:hypothetical protein
MTGEFMQIGIVFPQNEIVTDPLVIRDWAGVGEGAGFDTQRKHIEAIRNFASIIDMNR